MITKLAERALSVAQVAQFFDYAHLPPRLKPVSAACSVLADDMMAMLPDSPELAWGLRQLLLAKDAFVRCASTSGKS